MVMEVGPRYVSPFPILQSNRETQTQVSRQRIYQVHVSKSIKNSTLLRRGLGGDGGGGLLGFRFGRAFLHIAVLPADSGVYGVTPGSSVSVRVPAQIPPEVPVEDQKVKYQPHI